MAHIMGFRVWGGFHSKVYHFGSPQDKDCNLLGSRVGSPNFGKLPYLGKPHPTCWFIQKLVPDVLNSGVLNADEQPA